MRERTHEGSDKRAIICYFLIHTTNLLFKFLPDLLVFKYTTKNNERILMWQMFSLAILRQTEQAMVTLFKTAVFCCYLSTLFNTQGALTFEFELFGMAEAQCNVHLEVTGLKRELLEIKQMHIVFFRGLCLQFQIERDAFARLLDIIVCFNFKTREETSFIYFTFITV